jgi:hypothetical protein
VPHHAFDIEDGTKFPVDTEGTETLAEKTHFECGLALKSNVNG